MLKNILIQNSFWAVFSSMFQNIVFSIFFIIIARSYEQQVFSSYIIANTLYGLLLSFSSLGMAQWFIRSHSTEEKNETANLFFTIQFYAGSLFYFLNICLSFMLYSQTTIHALSLILGFNIICDNLIYVYKTVNIVINRQKQTFVVLGLEAFFKLILAFLVYYLVPNILLIAFILSFLRFLSLAIFIKLNDQLSFLKIFKSVRIISFNQVLSTVYLNRYFFFIGTISLFFWSIGGILVSKFLDLEDVAHYEISYKLFTMAEIIPLMVLNTVFPIIVKRIQEKTFENAQFLKMLSYGSLLYGLLAYTFIFSFADELIPLLFGVKYSGTPKYCIEMFLTMTIFPSVLYQANLLIAIKMEKTDMYLNMMSLILNILIAGFGLYFNKTLSSVTYSIFTSFLVFHLLQAFFLVKKEVIVLNDALIEYIILFGFILCYPFLLKHISPYFLYPLLLSTVLIVSIPTLKKYFAKT